MKQKTTAMLVFVMLVLLFVFPALCCAGQETAPAEAKSSTARANEVFTIQEGQPIRSDQVMSQKHPPFARGMVCVECHKVTFDAITKLNQAIHQQLPAIT